MAAHTLYLIRHAIAAERGSAYPDDSLRPLTREGINHFRTVVAGLAKLGVSFDHVVTSPFKRARQTAELVVGRLKAPVVEVAALAPGGSIQTVMRELAHYKNDVSLAVVGHEPDLSELADRLLRSSVSLRFKKGGVCRIDVDAFPPKAPGTLSWHLAPKIFLKLHRDDAKRVRGPRRR